MSYDIGWPTELEALVAALDAVLDIEDDDESAQVGIDIIAEHLDWPVAKAAGLWNGYKATCRRENERLSNEELIAFIKTAQEQIAEMDSRRIHRVRRL